MFFDIDFIFLQYFMKWQRESINRMIEDGILEAESKGVRVLSLGLLNQASKALQPDMFVSKCN